MIKYKSPETPPLASQKIYAPLSDEAAAALRTGDRVLLSGAVYTARDAAHQRLADLLKRGEEPPFPFTGQIVFYAGPCPARPGAVIGPVGPTTSGRMDAFSPDLIDRGLKYMIGKGPRNQATIEAVKRRRGVYFAALGGAAALMSRRVVASEITAFEDLGPEAVRRLTVEDLPLIVALDASGRDIYIRSLVNDLSG